MAFTLNKINLNHSRKSVSLKRLSDIVFMNNSERFSKYRTPIVVLLDKNYSSEQIETIDNFLSMNGIERSILISSIVLDLNDTNVAKELSSLSVTKFYRKYRSDIESIIPEKCSIITSGPALYSLLMEDDIYPNHVHQYIFGKSYFTFSKDLTDRNNHKIFPIDSFDELFPVKKVRNISASDSTSSWLSSNPIDSYKTKLAIRQFSLAERTADVEITPFPIITKIKIKSNEEFHNEFYEKNKDKHGYVAWDLETSGFDFLKDEIGCITLSFDGETGYYIPWKYVNKSELNEILKNNKQIGANLKFDCKFLWNNGVPAAKIDEDVIIIGHVLDETRSNSLKSLAFYFSEFGGYERALDDYKEKTKVDNYLNIPEHILSEYATMDAIVTYRVWSKALSYMKKCDEKANKTLELYYSGIEKSKVTPAYVNMVDYYYNRRIPAVNMYAKIEYEGLYINKDKLDNLRAIMKKYINKDIIEDKLRKNFNNDIKELNKKRSEKDQIKLIGPDFNWKSMRDLGNLLVNVLGWEDLGRTETGEIQVSDFQLDRWEKNHPMAKELSLMKSLNTLLNGFVGDDEGTKGWPQYMVKHDDGTWRIHANYKAMFTDSGRTKCSNPNFQNIPTRGQFSQEIKGCICSPNDEDYYIATLDYSSLQMRLACIDCGDENLSSAFYVPGVDVHSKTAYLSFFADKEIDVENIDVEQNGKHYHFLGGQLVLTKRGEVLAKDLTEDDEIID